jgi:hypothetical protein
LGIAACIDIPRNEKLTLLVDGCADLEHVVRIEILRALEQLGGHDCMLLLRMKALLGDREPAVVGQAIESVLRLEGEAALDWAQRFLKRGTDEMREEAALAISASRIPGAVDVLLSAWKAESPSIARSGYLRALSQSRDPAALEFLLGLIEAGPTPDAIDALHALASHAGRPESVARIAQAVELRNQDHVRADFHNLFPALPSAEA